MKQRKRVRLPSGTQLLPVLLDAGSRFLNVMVVVRFHTGRRGMVVWTH